mgnify:CR=1 FL=1
MKPQKRIIIVLILVIIIFMIIGIVGITISGTLNHRFFTDIDNFSRLDEYAVKNIELSDDKYLGELEVVSYYTKVILYNGKEYLVFAYVFPDVDSTITYFKKCTGVSSEINWNFHSSSNYFTYSEYIAYYECCLYRIEGGSYKEFVDAVNFINKLFPIEYSELSQNQLNE